MIHERASVPLTTQRNIPLCVARPKFFLSKKQSKWTHTFLIPERMSPLLRRTLVRATSDGAKKNDPKLVRKRNWILRAHFSVLKRLNAQNLFLRILMT